MDLYFAGGSTPELDEWACEKGYNRLASYVNDKKQIANWIELKKENKSSFKLFVDSGAFSMWTKGKTLDVDQYIDWLNERVDYIDLFGQIDVIPGEMYRTPSAEEVDEAAKETWENYLYMRERVINKDGLLYTFHVGEPLKYLKTALEYKDENGEPMKYMALGGMVGKPTPIRKSFLDSCFMIIRESSNPNIQVHTFGMTSNNLLSQYPITSADSTSWSKAAIYGSVYSKFGTIKVSSQQTQNKKNSTTLSLNSLQPNELASFKQYIEDEGFTLDELQESQTKRGEFNMQYLAESMKSLVQEPTHRKLFKLF